jgi:hypothetical protein
MRITIAVPTVLGALSWLLTLIQTKGEIPSIFIPSGVPSEGLPSLTAFSSQFLRWDWVFVFGAMVLWLGWVYATEGSTYLPSALKGGSTAVGWMGMVAAAAAIGLSLGPGAMVGVGWWWREEVRAAELEKSVLKMEVQRKVDALLRANGA